MQRNNHDIDFTSFFFSLSQICSLSSATMVAEEWSDSRSPWREMEKKTSTCLKTLHKIQAGRKVMYACSHDAFISFFHLIFTVLYKNEENCTTRSNLCDTFSTQSNIKSKGKNILTLTQFNEIHTFKNNDVCHNYSFTSYITRRAGVSHSG